MRIGHFCFAAACLQSTFAPSYHLLPFTICIACLHLGHPGQILRFVQRFVIKYLVVLRHILELKGWGNEGLIIRATKPISRLGSDVRQIRGWQGFVTHHLLSGTKNLLIASSIVRICLGTFKLACPKLIVNAKAHIYVFIFYRLLWRSPSF